MREGDFTGLFGAGRTFTFEAHLPQEAFDKILGNTPEEMDRMLQPGYAFDLSDGADRTVVYISFPKYTKPEDVVRVVRCRECKYWDRSDPFFFYGGVRCECKRRENEYWTADGFCSDAERNDSEIPNS